MSDLTKEHYFNDDDSTTQQGISQLADSLLRQTWIMSNFSRSNGEQSPSINLHNLGWKFRFNDRKRAAGLCSYTKKTVYISRWLLQQNYDQALEFENTLRHELAHAIDHELGRRSNHGAYWKAIARHILCTGDRCFSSDVIQTKVTTKYTLICDTCDATSPSHKRRRGSVACTPCCKKHANGRYDERFKLRQVQNY